MSIRDVLCALSKPAHTAKMTLRNAPFKDRRKLKRLKNLIKIGLLDLSLVVLCTRRTREHYKTGVIVACHASFVEH